MPNPEDLVDIEELAEIIGFGNTTIRRWMAKGMPSHLIHRGLRQYRRFDPREVQAWLEEERSKP